MGGKRDKTAQNLPLPEICFHSWRGWGDGAYPQQGGQEEVRTIQGRGLLSRAKLLCLLLTTCQAYPTPQTGKHRREWQPSLGRKGLQDSATWGSESLTTSTWPHTPERAEQKLYTSHRQTYTSKHILRPGQCTFIHIPLTSLDCEIFKDTGCICLGHC